MVADKLMSLVPPDRIDGTPWETLDAVIETRIYPAIRDLIAIYQNESRYYFDSDLEVQLFSYTRLSQPPMPAGATNNKNY